MLFKPKEPIVRKKKNLSFTNDAMSYYILLGRVIGKDLTYEELLQEKEELKEIEAGFRMKGGPAFHRGMPARRMIHLTPCGGSPS